MNMDIKEMLYNLGKKNDVIGEQLDFATVVNQMETEVILKSEITFLHIRDALFGMGEILEINNEAQYYLSTIRVGGSGAVMIVHMSENAIEIASYAKEGLIKQHLAKRAIQAFINNLINVQSRH